MRCVRRTIRTAASTAGWAANENGCAASRFGHRTPRSGYQTERTSGPRRRRRGGAAFPSLAGLLRDGHDVTVFERRPDMRPGGGAVTIWSNGSTVLEQLGVDMDGAGQLLSTVRIATSTGRPLVNIDVTTIVAPAGRTRSDGPTSSPA